MTTDWIGAVVQFAADHTPRGWLRCDGSMVQIKEYRELYELVGTRWGGDGVTTFALPNVPGRWLIRADGDMPHLPEGAAWPAGLDFLTAGVGPQGPQGPQGVQGEVGPMGPQGPKGDTGDTGPQGPQGVQGPVGPAGATGATGATGPKGDTGEAGPQGLQGIQGPAGAIGPKGDTGEAGPQGLQGPAGAIGPQGVQGAIGPQGPQGPAGGGVVDVTYTALRALMTNAALTVGTWYRITDFQSRWYLTSGDELCTGDSGTGPTEPLLVLAVATSALARTAYSTTHPNDLLWYESDPQPVLDSGSVYFVNNGVLIAGWKGLITRRVDKVRQVDVGFDWRNVTFRRWKVLPPNTWAAATTYALRAIVQHNGKVWVSVLAGNVGEAPGSGTKWAPLFGVDTYSSCVSNNVQVNVLGNLVAIAANAAVYVDRLTFNGFAPANFTNPIPCSAMAYMLPNNFFGLEEDLPMDVYVGGLLTQNTFSGCSNVWIQGTCSGNYIGSLSYVVASQVYGNYFDLLQRITFSSEFSYNVGSSLDYVVGLSFSGNVFSSGIGQFSHNHFVSSCSLCKFATAQNVNVLCKAFGYDFRLNTHLPAVYNKQVNVDAANAVRVSYYNASGAWTTVAL